MGKAIIWSPSARGDLRSIVSYIATDNPDAAIKTGQRIIDRSKQIEEFEGSARIVPEFRDKSIKELIEGNYRIIFRIQSNQIEVVRVWHAARGRPQI
jgi:plasmid stabilization system protein ParE